MALRSRPWLPGFIQSLDQSEYRVFSQFELRILLDKERHPLGIPLTITVSKLIKLLLHEGLSRLEIHRETHRSAVGGKTRYIWRQASPYAIGLSLAKGSYLSHASAIFLNALGEQVPKTIYVNKEQSPKPLARGTLTQPAIDRAFRGAPRTSKYVFVSDDNRYVLLSGKNTGRLGVSRIPGPDGALLDTTTLERTLIDCVVRPAYAGGLEEVLNAYRAARNKVSVNTLLGLLRKLQYVYPYHQSIGFLMQRAGYSQKHLAKCEALGANWKFYLDYKIPDPALDEHWQLYYPKGL